MTLKNKDLEQIAYLARININKKSFPSLKKELELLKINRSQWMRLIENLFTTHQSTEALVEEKFQINPEAAL